MVARCKIPACAGMTETRGQYTYLIETSQP